MRIKNELKKESFLNDLESILDDIRLLLKDYDFDIDDYLEEDDEEIDDEDISFVVSFYKQMIKTLDN